MTTMMRWLVLSLGLAALAACGGDDDDDASGDGDADADGDGDGDADARVFVLASDFASSVYGWASLADLADFHELGPAEGDAVVVESNGRYGIIERTLGAVTLLADDLSIERNFSVADEGGPAPNPHDIAIVSDTKAYVVRLGQGTIAIVDPSTGMLTGTIDLSSHDPDGVPDMDAIAVVGNRAFVSLELLDENFAPRGVGELVAIDTESDAVERTITLPVPNPYGRFRASSNSEELLVPCVGVFGEADGGIVAYGVDADAPRMVVTEQALGGDVGSFVIADNTHGFAIVAREFITYLVTFDPSTGDVGDSILDSEGWDLRDVELVGGQIVVADGAPTAPGLRVFDLDGTEVTSAPVDVGLPPSVVLAM